MTEPKFLIKTKMDKEDYRKFLYIAAFLKKKTTIPLLALIALIVSILINWSNDFLSPISVIVTWIILFAVSIGAICFGVERKMKQRLSSDRIGTFNTTSVLKFYDDKVIMENDSLNSTGELRYEQFYQLLESKDFFIFYLNINQASLLRKKDIDNIEKFKHFITTRFAESYKNI